MAYNPHLAYEADESLALGSMNHKCKYCNALKWKEETPGMCCNNGKVQLPSFEHFRDPLNSLLMDRHPHHNHFMDFIRKYNRFMPTFKVQGQVYHLVGSFMHKPDQNAQILQIYFVGEDETEIRLRWANFPDVKSGKPTNAHVGHFNQFENRDIVFQSHDNKLQRTSEIHRSYDALQYPLMFCHGENGYSIDMPLFSAASFYAYRIMIRKDEVNHIVYFRSLVSQFLVNTPKSKLKELRTIFILKMLWNDVLKNDVNAIDLGQIVVPPSSFTGGPRYMHEGTQEAMTYVHVHGRLDLFITFTCNPIWKDIIDALFYGQKPHDRHDIIARNQISSKIIDNVISAEIPDPEQDPLLYDIVKSNMIHRPCGSLNPNAPCMKENTCSKRYPRKLFRETQTGDDGYPEYKRRSTMIRETNRNTINFLTDSNTTTSPKEAANTLGIMFQENSSNFNYDPEILSKAHIYNNPTNTVSPRNNVQTHLNSSLLIIELEEALRN
ncbi:hypothetical protein QTP88_025283 [Uroleucon formosanum]